MDKEPVANRPRPLSALAVALLVLACLFDANAGLLSLLWFGASAAAFLGGPPRLGVAVTAACAAIFVVREPLHVHENVVRMVELSACAVVALTWWSASRKVGADGTRTDPPARAKDAKMASLIAWTRPASAFMDRLPYLSKFTVIGVLTLIPLGSVTRLQYDIATERITFNAKETLGVDYVEPARGFLYALQRHRVLTVASMLGDPNVRPEQIAGARADADAAAVLVDHLDAELGGDGPNATPYGPGLRTTKRWRQAKSAWDVLKLRSFVAAAEADRVHAEVSAIVVDLVMNYAANYSNLILDPDLDSYWLMDAFVQKMPPLTEAISGATTLAILPLAGANDAARSERLVDLAGLYSSATALATELDSVNMATVFREAPSYSKSSTVGALRAPLAATRASVKGAAEGLRRTYLGGSDVAAAEKWRSVDETLEALRVSHDLWRQIGPELRKMCQWRVDTYRRQRTTGLVTSGLGSLVLLYIFIGFYASVQRAVSTLGAAARRMVAGTNEPLLVTSNDEVARIAESFNQINAALIDARGLREEHDQLARDLHDEILQRLYAIGLGLEVLKLDLAPEAATVRSRVDDALRSLKHVMTGIRNVLAGASVRLAEQAENEDLEAKLRSLAKELAEYGVPNVEFDVDPALPGVLTREQSHQIALIAGEAMSNSARHAHARSARLSLKEQGGHIVFEWKDDGIGIPPKRRRGYGIENMKARSAMIGGKLELHSATGQGTQVLVRFPREARYA